MEHITSSATIVVMDRHALFRNGVTGLLNAAHPEWQCVDVATLDELRQCLPALSQATVLVDLHAPNLAAAGGIGRLVADHPHCLFIGLSDEDDRSEILACLCAGARGYVLRTTNETQFLRAVETVIAGGVFAPATLTASPARHDAMAAGETMRLDDLTDRQRDVLNLLVEGCATKTIARRLNLAVGTVKIHLSAIYRALGANTRLEAVTKAHRMFAM